MQRPKHNFKFFLAVSILLLAALACGSESSAQTPTLVDEQDTPTVLSEPTDTPIVEDQPTQTPQPISTVERIVDVYTILGKSVSEVENILGQTALITPNDDNDDNLAGGEYRDYEIVDYLVTISYDKDGVARIFQIIDGLSDENYSISEWDIVLSKFGVFPNSFPDREAPAAVYWDNDNGYFIAVFASSASGTPVWSVQISEVAFKP
jgi:hypothetical protein